MTKVFASVAAVAFALTVASATALGGQTLRGEHKEKVRELRSLSLELVGQFQNSPPGALPVTHVHYGYLSYVRGVDAFRAAPQDETTALFTFYASGATLRVISDGPLRVITRVGTFSVYRDPSTNGNFSNADTFRDGTPIVIASFRQQSILNTVTNSTSVFHKNVIRSTVPFDTPKGRVQLGIVGETFTTYFGGQVNMPGPPSGFIAGYAVSG
jgi:hypothetical protein